VCPAAHELHLLSTWSKWLSLYTDSKHNASRKGTLDTWLFIHLTSDSLKQKVNMLCSILFNTCWIFCHFNITYSQNKAGYNKDNSEPQMPQSLPETHRKVIKELDINGTCNMYGWRLDYNGVLQIQFFWACYKCAIVRDGLTAYLWLPTLYLHLK
jgi:hypothetical protein